MSVGHVYIDSTVTFAPDQISSRNCLLLCPILISSSGQITLISDDFFSRTPLYYVPGLYWLFLLC